MFGLSCLMNFVFQVLFLQGNMKDAGILIQDSIRILEVILFAAKTYFLCVYFLC